MGKRYYCDYCDRSFIDDISSRKKHLNGLYHDRNKKLHYKLFRDIRATVEEEKAKPECKKYISSGVCTFGEHCHFTHYTKQELQNLEWQANELERQKRLSQKAPTVEEWLQKRVDKSSGKSSEIEYISNYPFMLNSIATLPPSLRPISSDQINDTTFATWG